LNSAVVLVAGEPVHAWAGLWLDGVEDHGDQDIFWAGPEEGPFYGYIVPAHPIDDAFPPPLPDNALYVGEVVFSGTDDSQIMDVNLDFVLPDLEPGEYYLLHCNDPCTRQIGDTMSTRITVVEDQGQAFIADRMNRFDRTLINLRARSGNRVHNLESVASRLSSQVNSMEAQLATLERQLERASQAKPVSASPPWGPLAIGAGMASLIAALARSWLLRHPTSGEALGTAGN
jgi:hypothetical protein